MPDHTLPLAIHLFFGINPSNIAACIPHCFQQEAIVKDEDKTHIGHVAILHWLQHAFQSSQFHTQPLQHHISLDRVTSTALVSGNFQNSPVKLTYQFQLKENLITYLEISV